MTKILREIFLGVLFCIFVVHATAQTTTYPVQVYTQLIPPYTPFVPSYYAGGVEKMRVTLVNTDMQQPLMTVFLKMKITSSTFSMQTPDWVRLPSVTLQAGIPAILSSTDLEPYFRKENLSVSGGQNQFYQTWLLPDNFYRFSFEACDLNTGRLLSNTKVGFAMAMIAAGDPPRLNIPLKGSVIQESNIPNIMFSWTPRHLNSVASAYGTEYEFSLVEIYDKQTAPENAFQYSRVLFTERTRSNSLIYTAAYPPLQPGLRYAWRIQAVAREGLDDAQVFKNSGYSEIFWFDYKGNCSSQVMASGVVTQEMGATVRWQPTPAIDYALDYRKKGGSKWYAGNVSGTSCSIYNLQPGATYEYRIGTRCYPNDVYDYTEIKGFTMPDRPEKSPNCGMMPDVNLSNREPLQELQPGLPVFAGDFPVFITQVSGGNGHFSGTGYIGIPFTGLPRITVTFNDILVNSDHRLTGGYFETKYDIKNNNLLFDIDQTLTGGKGVGDIRTGEERAQYVVNYTINPDMKVKPVVSDNGRDEIQGGDNYVFTKNENGKYEFILTDSEGNEHKVESDTMPVTIQDKSGTTYQIDEKGNIIYVENVIVSPNALPNNVNYYFIINNDSVALVNHTLNVAKTTNNFKIEIKSKNDTIKLDSVYLIVNSDTIKNTLVTKNFSSNLLIQAKKIGQNDTLAYVEIIVHNAPYVEFTTNTSYNGEFGFDDGMDFNSNNGFLLPKNNMVYDTIRNSDGAILYCPFITMNPVSKISIKANIINKMIDYDYIAESSTSNITCSYNIATSELQITNNNRRNNFSTPDYIYLYRKDKNSIDNKTLIGKCEIISIDKDPVINVQIIYYQTDTIPFTNTINPIDLQDKMNNHSLNQAFKVFDVNNTIYTIRDSTAIDSIHFSNPTKAYMRAYSRLMADKLINPSRYNKSNTFYVIMSDLEFLVDPLHNGYSGGGVYDSKAYAVMFKVPGVMPNDFPELVAHECGHALQLLDTFRDPVLGNPSQGFSRHNYMDYFIIRNMFFKTQIKTMFNQKNTVQ